MTHHLLFVAGTEAVGEQGEHYDPLFTYRAAASSSAHSQESGSGAADVGPSGVGTSKGSPVKSSSVEWSAGYSTDESGPAAYVESGKNFPMGPLDSDEADEVTSALGMTMISWSSPVCCVSFLNLVYCRCPPPRCISFEGAGGFS